MYSISCKCITFVAKTMQRILPRVTPSVCRKPSGDCPDSAAFEEPVLFEELSGAKRGWTFRTAAELSTPSGRLEALKLLRTYNEAYEAHFQYAFIADDHIHDRARYYEEFRYPNCDGGMYYSGKAPLHRILCSV